jgi:pimeloyl-ACP methyl ester carboxylesterase
MIAQEMAINYPERVRTLQLHATLARVDPFLRAVGQSLLHARATLGREEYVRLLLTWVLSPRTYAEHADNVEMMVRIMVDHPYPASLAGLTRQAEACWAHDTLARLGRIQCPTLIAVGADDIFVPPRFSQELHARIPGAELRVIEGGGHGYLWEQAPAFNEACLQFLRKHS